MVACLRPVLERRHPHSVRRPGRQLRFVTRSLVSRYLVGALPDRSAHAFVVDGSDRLIGPSQAGLRVGQRVGDAQFSRALASGHGAYNAQTGGAGYLVSVAIGGSDWRVAITEPTSILYRAVVGSQWWVMWAVSAAFAVASLIGVHLLRRTLSAAARIVEQAPAGADHALTGECRTEMVGDTGRGDVGRLAIDEDRLERQRRIRPTAPVLERR
jgi:hypothetical protein